MTQDRSRHWIRVLSFSVVALVALGLATAVLLNANSAVSEAQGGEIALDRGSRAQADRLTRLAKHFLGSAQSNCLDPSLTRGQEAYASRLSAQAAHYLGSSVVRTPVLDRGGIAEAERLRGMARHFGAEPDLAPPALACAILP